MKIVLKNGAEVVVAEATYNGHYVVNCTNAPEYQAIWNQFSPNNLGDFTVIDDEGKVVLRKLNPFLSSVQAIINKDKTVVGHFYFTGGVTIPNEYERAAKILLGEEE